MTATQHSCHGRFRHSEEWRNGPSAFAFGVKPYDCRGVGRRDLGSPMGRAARVNASVFPFHVAHVVSLSAKEQMRRLNAEPVVASMAYAQLPYGADEKLMGCAVRKHLPAGHATGAVTLASVLGARPDKAAAWVSPRLQEESSFGIFKAMPAVSSPVHTAHCALNRQERQKMEGMAMGNGELQSAAIEPVGCEEVLK